MTSKILNTDDLINSGIPAIYVYIFVSLYIRQAGLREIVYVKNHLIINSNKNSIHLLIRTFLHLNRKYDS